MGNLVLLADISGRGVEYHVGDEAMADVAISRLSKLVGADRLRMGCARPENIWETYGINAFPLYSATDALRRRQRFTRPHSVLKATLTTYFELMSADAVFVCGGGNLTSEWPGVLEARLRFLETARALRRPIVFASQTIGPFSDHHRQRVDSLLSYAKWIGVRDRTFSRTQTSVPVRFAVDDACFLEPRHSGYSRSFVSDHGRVAVLSMRNFGSATPVMLKAVAEIVAAEAEAENLTTVFIPHHAPEGVGGDIKLANQVAAVFEASRFSIVDPIPLAAELKAITSEAEWVVTMRYHQLVFALSQGIPAVGISVNPYTHAKLCGAFEQMKLDPIVTSLEQAPERLSVLLGLAKSRRSEFIAAAREFSEREIAASFAPYQYVADLMK